MHPFPLPALAHRATDVDEKARIRSKGGKVVQGRVMGVLEPSRVIGVSLLKNLAAQCFVVSSGLFVKRTFPILAAVEHTV